MGFARFATVFLAAWGVAASAAAQKTLPAEQPRPAPASPPAQGDYLSPGVERDVAFGAYQRGYFITAFGEANKRVAANDRAAPAMTLIGELYKEGLGARQDDAEAARWFKLAAERGDPEGAFSLALSHLQGKGVPSSVEKARPLLEQAARSGHPAALYQLGLLSLSGDLQDSAKAADYFRRADEAGDYDATYALGLAYKEGRGVEKDAGKALDLLRKAADNHISAAQTDYAIMLFNGEGAPADEAGAAKYFARAAAANNPVAMNRLARLYAFGRGVRTDQVEAMKWHILARSGGVPDERLDEMLRKLDARDQAAVQEAVRKFAGR
jgi:TPR repeat protein